MSRYWMIVDTHDNTPVECNSAFHHGELIYVFKTKKWAEGFIYGMDCFKVVELCVVEKKVKK